MYYFNWEAYQSSDDGVYTVGLRRVSDTNNDIVVLATG